MNSKTGRDDVKALGVTNDGYESFSCNPKVATTNLNTERAASGEKRQQPPVPTKK